MDLSIGFSASVDKKQIKCKGKEKGEKTRGSFVPGSLSLSNIEKFFRFSRILLHIARFVHLFRRYFARSFQVQRGHKDAI